MKNSLLFVIAILALHIDAHATDRLDEVVEIYSTNTTAITLEALRQYAPAVKWERTVGHDKDVVYSDNSSIWIHIQVNNPMTGRPGLIRKSMSHLINNKNFSLSELVFRTIDSGTQVWIVVMPQLDNRNKLLIRHVASFGIIVQYISSADKTEPSTPACYNHKGIMLLGPDNNHARELWLQQAK